MTAWVDSASHCPVPLASDGQVPNSSRTLGPRDVDTALSALRGLFSFEVSIMTEDRKTVWQDLMSRVEKSRLADEIKHKLYGVIEWTKVLNFIGHTMDASPAVDGVKVTGWSIKSVHGESSVTITVRGNRRGKPVVTFHRAKATLPGLRSLAGRLARGDVAWADDRFAGERASDDDGEPPVWTPNSL